MGILICGLNGAGKSTLGKRLAERLGWQFIDNEELYFPKMDTKYAYSSPRGKEEVIRLLEERIEKDRRFVFAAVKGDYGDRLLSLLDCIIVVSAPRETRLARVRERSLRKFGIEYWTAAIWPSGKAPGFHWWRAGRRIMSTSGSQRRIALSSALTGR